MKTIGMILVWAAVAAMLSIPTPVLAVEAPTTAAIESAESPADHGALADAYEAQAKQARAQAQMHTNMARSYGKSSALASKGTMATHCRNLAASYTRAAEKYDQLAKAHRDLATGGK